MPARSHTCKACNYRRNKPRQRSVASLKTIVGEFVAAGKPVFTLIDTTHWYVIANFRETELKKIHEGTPARYPMMAAA